MAEDGLIRSTIYLKEKHKQAIEKIKENQPAGTSWSLSAYIRQKLEEDFPEHFDE